MNYPDMKEHTGLLQEVRKKTGWNKRTEIGTPLNYCICCGREVNLKTALSVMLNHIDGEIVDFDKNADEDVYSMYEVGADCAKKHLKGVKLPSKSSKPS